MFESWDWSLIGWGVTEAFGACRAICGVHIRSIELQNILSYPPTQKANGWRPRGRSMKQTWYQEAAKIAPSARSSNSSTSASGQPQGPRHFCELFCQGWWLSWLQLAQNASHVTGIDPINQGSFQRFDIRPKNSARNRLRKALIWFVIIDIHRFSARATQNLAQYPLTLWAEKLLASAEIPMCPTTFSTAGHCHGIFAG